MAIDLPIRKDVVDPGFRVMERHIDLNKHAFDLNEVPLIDLNVGFLHDGSTSSSSSSSLSPHTVMNTAPCPKKGGWLELFQTMFGHENSRIPQGFVPVLGSNGTIVNQQDQYGVGPMLNPTYHRLNDAILNPRDRCVNGAALLNRRDRCVNDAIMDLRDRYANDATPNLRHQHVKDDMRKSRDRRGIAAIPIPNDGCVSGAILNPNDRCVNDAIPNLNDLCANDAIPNLNDQCANDAIPNLNDQSINSAILKPQLEDLSLNQNDNERTSHKCGEQMNRSFSGCGKPQQKMSFSHRGSRKHYHRGLSHGPFLPFADPVTQLVETKSSYQVFGQVDISSINKLGHEDIGSISSRDFLMNGENPNKAPLHLDLNSQPLPGWDVEPYENSSMYQEQNRGLNSFRDNGESPSNSGKTSEPIISNNMPETPVKIIESPDWLPPGWITELKTRKAGSTAGTRDKYYKDPVTGRRFRSKNEVTSFLETGHGCKYKSHIQFVELSIPMHPVSASFLPNQDYRKDSVENARFPYGKDLAENASFSHRKDLVESASFPYRKDSSESASLYLDMSHSTSGSCNGSLERISIKQEQDDMRDEQIGCVDGVTAPCQFGGLIMSRNNASKEEYNLLETITEPGLQNKRRKLIHKPQGLASAHTSLNCKSKQDQNCLEWWKRELKETSEDGKDTHISLICKEEQSKAQDHDSDRGRDQTMLIQPLSKPNVSVLSLKGIDNASEKAYERELCPKPSSGNKPLGRKILKLTLKQERELLISLGQKLCRRVFALANEKAL